MTTTGIDYAWWRPSLSKIKGDGFTFVSRYLSWLPNGKVINKAEYDALINAGFTVFLNWEYAAKDALRGAAGGTKDAIEAVRQAKALGYPAGATIYFSADFDETPSQAPTVLAYSVAAAKVVRAAGYRYGTYGGYYAVKRLFDAHAIDDAWQTYAWSGGQWDSRAHLRQVLNGIYGGQADRDVMVGTVYGAVKKPPAPKPPAYLKYPLPSSDWFGVDDGTPHSHSGKTSADKANVKRIQKLVGAGQDGDFGPNTKAAVIRWQRARGLAPDGKFGPKSWAAAKFTK